MHEVENLQSCCKFAFNYLDAKQLQMSGWLSREIFPVVAQAMKLPDDQSGVLKRVVDEIR